MTSSVFTINSQEISALDTSIKQRAINALETGQIIYFSSYFFTVQANEQNLLREAILHPKHKNISYDYLQQKIAGLTNSSEYTLLAQNFMRRFAEFAKQLVDLTLPRYKECLQWGRTSYRPAEIKGRMTSKRKDDTRLHVDSFPATPVRGLRILRVFCNINPEHQPRIW